MQLGLSVKTEGEFAKNDDIEFHMLWDRRRRNFWNRPQERSRPTETVAVVGKGFVWQDGTVSVRSDMWPDTNGWDLSIRPYHKHQAAVHNQVGKYLRLSKDAPFTGTLLVKMTSDGKNLDFVLGGEGWAEHNLVVYRLKGSDVTGINPAAKITGIEPDQLVPGCEIEMQVEVDGLLSTNRRRVPVFRSLWDNGKPRWIGPRRGETLDLVYPKNRRLLREFCTLLDHACKVATNRSEFVGLLTPDEWAPSPYIGFKSPRDLVDVVTAPSFRLTTEMAEGMRLVAAEAECFPQHITDSVGLVTSVTSVNDGRHFMLGFHDGRIRRLPGHLGQPILFRASTDAPIESFSCVSELKNRKVDRTSEILIPASAEDFSSATQAEQVFGSRLPSMITAFLERQKAVVGQLVYYPAPSVRSAVKAAARNERGQIALAWKLRRIEKYREVKRGQFFAPPVYCDLENPAPFYLNGVEYFAGMPREFEDWRREGKTEQGSSEKASAPLES